MNAVSAHTASDLTMIRFLNLQAKAGSHRSLRKARSDSPCRLIGGKSPAFRSQCI
jgi:hypothetical protein